MNRPAIVAAVATAAVAVLIVLLLCLTGMTFDPEGYPPVPRPTTELVELEPEFVEMFDPAVVPANPQPAYSAQPAKNESTPAPADGSDLENAGEAAAAVPDVTSERPAPVQRPKRTCPTKPAPPKRPGRDKARREAQKGVSNAFKASEESADNTASKGSDKGDSGKPDGAASDVDGTGQGTVGGGWIMPRYAKVQAYQTGSIELRAIVGRDGSVLSVELVGGKAPASGDPALVERCKAEVRRHRFTRNDNDAPERATARIIYRFR